MWDNAMQCKVIALCALLLAGCAGHRLETRFATERTVLLRDGAEYDFRACLAEQLRRHPAMRASLGNIYRAPAGDWDDLWSIERVIEVMERGEQL